MENSLLQNVYNPDVLSCIASLSNDEVFTPPELANKIIDMLPQELFENPDTTFLDPCCKSGVFLREIAKRLIAGLERQMPDIEKRIEHIFTKQLFGIAVTELTSLLSRRTLYCSKFPSSKYSAYQFPEDNPQGNIIYQRINHTWKDGKCVYCGASQKVYDRGEEAEAYAYQFIHNLDVNSLFNMKFDVIIGNPPYHMNDGGAKASAGSLYHLFVQQAKKLNPRYLTMIIPARWYAGGKGLDDFRKEMLEDRHIKILHDFNNASECFPNVEIKGGVCYFLWDKDYIGDCIINTHSNNTIVSTMERPLSEEGSDSFIRQNEAISIFRKVQNKKEISFSSIVSSRKPFGLATNFNDFRDKYFSDSVTIYANQRRGFVDKKTILGNLSWVDKFKILIPEAIGVGDMTKDWLKPIVVGPNTCCTETYLVIGPFKDEEETQNAYSYMQTKFFHLLLGLKKITQHTTSKVYELIPIQDFSKPWTDKELYEKYKLTQDEIEYIESMIKPME